MNTNNEKITKEFCEGKTLIFQPKTEDEAAFIQRTFFAMGFKWIRDCGTKVGWLSECVLKGMALNQEGLCFSVSDDGKERGLLCAASQFDEIYMSPETTFLLAQFNKLAARIEEIATDVAEIKKQLQPEKLDKPVFKKPDSTP